MIKLWKLFAFVLVCGFLIFHLRPSVAAPCDLDAETWQQIHKLFPKIRIVDGKYPASGTIEEICSSADNWHEKKEDAIKHIDNEAFDYYVCEKGKTVKIRTTNAEPRYLKTIPNETPLDNLENLKPCKSRASEQ